MHSLSAFFVGVLFGAGLIVSGMTDPSKVIGFLDITGSWDPSLGLVMGGAVGVGLIAFRAARGRTTPILGGTMGLPAERQIDRRLILGSLAFGIGWGLAGFCPGPALVAFGADYDKAVVFTIAMLAGMVLFELAERFLKEKTK
ncbi:MAG TPA: DUF6691 family protein [Burkholderiales bacterium]|nr:DUF6691 family protein [Burkholderiales bacterium]